jgi:hypothetical protein
MKHLAVLDTLFLFTENEKLARPKAKPDKHLVSWFS